MRLLFVPPFADTSVSGTVFVCGASVRGLRQWQVRWLGKRVVRLILIRGKELGGKERGDAAVGVSSLLFLSVISPFS